MAKVSRALLVLIGIMRWGDSAEWHDATDVWFGLTANFWQKKLPLQKIDGVVLPDWRQQLGGLDSNRRGHIHFGPAAVMRFDGGMLQVVGRGTDYHYWRAISVNGGADWQGWYQVAPGSVFSSGPAALLESDGVSLRIYGRGTAPSVPPNTIPDPEEPRFWGAFSPDGGNTWPGGSSKIVPAVDSSP